MGIIFDAVFLLLIAVLVMTGVHRGVARSLLGLAGVLLAGFLAGHSANRLPVGCMMHH